MYFVWHMSYNSEFYQYYGSVIILGRAVEIWKSPPRKFNLPPSETLPPPLTITEMYVPLYFYHKSYNNDCPLMDILDMEVLQEILQPFSKVQHPEKQPESNKMWQHGALPEIHSNTASAKNTHCNLKSH